MLHGIWLERVAGPGLSPLSMGRFGTWPRSGEIGIFQLGGKERGRGWMRRRGEFCDLWWKETLMGREFCWFECQSEQSLKLKSNVGITRNPVTYASRPSRVTLKG